MFSYVSLELKEDDDMGVHEHPLDYNKGEGGSPNNPWPLVDNN